MMNCLSNNVHTCIMDTCEQMCNTKDLNVFCTKENHKQLLFSIFFYLFIVNVTIEGFIDFCYGFHFLTNEVLL